MGASRSNTSHIASVLLKYGSQQMAKVIITMPTSFASAAICDQTPVRFNGLDSSTPIHPDPWTAALCIETALSISVADLEFYSVAFERRLISALL